MCPVAVPESSCAVILRQGRSVPDGSWPDHSRSTAFAVTAPRQSIEQPPDTSSTSPPDTSTTSPIHVGCFLQCASCSSHWDSQAIGCEYPDFHKLTLRILAANRDEFLDRPTSPAQWHDFDGAAPKDQVLSGRDLGTAEKGTWLGITKDLRVGTV